MTITTFNQSVGAEVRAEMARQRLGVQALALELGWDQRYLSRRINDQVPWSTNDLEQVAEKLGIPVHALTSPRAVSA